VMYDVNLRALILQRRPGDHSCAGSDGRGAEKAFEEIVSLYKAGLETEAGTAKAWRN